MNKIWIIYLKEMTEVLRDRRTMIFMLVFPTVIMPLLFKIMFTFIEKQQTEARTQVMEVALIQAEVIPELSQMFRDNENFSINDEIKSVEDAKTAIRDGGIRIGIAFPEDVDEYLDAGYQFEVSAYYNNADPFSDDFLPRIQTILDSFNHTQRMARFEAVGVTSELQREGMIEPVKLVQFGIAENRERVGEAIGGLLPYFLILFAFLGGLYPAIDLGAGEKERGTLETLLLTPVPRTLLVLGKFLVVFTTSIISALLSVTSMGIFLSTQGENASGAIGEMIQAIGPLDFVMMGAVIVPLAAVLAALLLALSIYGKSFKEAQSLIAPLQFLIIIPAFLGMLPGIELNWKWAMVPVTNVSLAIKELMKGTIDYTMLIVILASTTVFAGLAIAFCVQWFKRESVLFRS